MTQRAEIVLKVGFATLVVGCLAGAYRGYRRRQGVSLPRSRMRFPATRLRVAGCVRSFVTRTTSIQWPFQKEENGDFIAAYQKWKERAS